MSANNFKGCADGQDCPERNRCKRYKERENCEETVMFYILYAPNCQFKMELDKKK